MKQPHPSSISKKGFSLLELLIAVALMAMMLLIALPSFDSLLQDQALQDHFQHVHHLVIKARKRSLETGQPHFLIFHSKQIALSPSLPSQREFDPRTFLEEDKESFLPIEHHETYQLQKPFALASRKQEIPRWTFWPSGNCEPVTLSYQGKQGKWKVKYHPLSAHYTLLELDSSSF